MPAILRTGRVCQSRADVACILQEHPSYSARARRRWGFASTKDKAIPTRYDPDLCFQQALSGLANQTCLHRVSYTCHRGNSSALQPTRWPCLRPLLTIPIYVLHAPWLHAREMNMRKQLAAIAAADVTWVKCINNDTVSALSIWQRSCLYPCPGVTRYTSFSQDGSPMPMSNRTLSLALKHKLAYWDMLERHLPAALVLEDDAAVPADLWAQLGQFHVPTDASIFWLGSFGTRGTLSRHPQVQGDPMKLHRRNASRFPRFLDGLSYIIFEHGAKQMMQPVLAPAGIGISYFNELDAGYRLDKTTCTDRRPLRLEVPPIQYGPPAPRWISWPETSAFLSYFRTPLMLGACSVDRTQAPCRIVSLPLHGTNPSLVRWNSTHLLGIARTTSVNSPTLRRCRNGINYTSHHNYRLFTDSSMFEANNDLTITSWRRLRYNASCASSFPSVADARLIAHQKMALVSHRCGRKFILSPLVSDDELGAHERVVLSTRKNGGIFAWRDHLFELTDVVPFRFRSVYSNGSDPPANGSAIPSAWAPYVKRARDVHNSVNPIYVSRLGGYLGMAHWFMEHGKFHVSHPTPAMFGYKYLQVFFLFSASSRRITRVSSPFCFPSLREPSMCDIIQFAMSIVEGVNGSLMISYGVNDCESAVAYMELDQIERMLVDAHDVSS